MRWLPALLVFYPTFVLGDKGWSGLRVKAEMEANGRAVMLKSEMGEGGETKVKGLGRPEGRDEERKAKFQHKRALFFLSGKKVNCSIKT